MFASAEIGGDASIKFRSEHPHKLRHKCGTRAWFVYAFGSYHDWRCMEVGYMSSVSFLFGRGVINFCVIHCIKWRQWNVKMSTAKSSTSKADTKNSGRGDSGQ